MDHDVKPRSHWGAVIGTAITVATTVWGASQWLNNRASTDDVRKLTNDSFLHRLELETMKGEMKSLNIQMTDLRAEVRSLNTKLDRKERRER